VQAGVLTQDALAAPSPSATAWTTSTSASCTSTWGPANLISSAAGQALRGRARAVHRRPRACSWPWPTPANVLAVDDIALMTGYEVRPAVASREDISALVGA
jgi:hypothetical protein